MDILIYIVAIVLLLMASGYFSGSEAALFSLPATRLKVYQSDKNPRKRLIASLLLKPRDLLVTIFMLNTLVNILLQNVSANLFGDFASWILKVGVPLVLTLVFGEILPKYIGIQTNTSFSYLVAPSINFFQNLLKPIRKITIAITAPVSKIMFFFLKKEASISKDELEHILKTSEQHGIFSADEGELISGFLELQDSLVKDWMWPREDILYYSLDEPLSKITHLFIDQECSRLPVCKNNLDNVIGILTAKQFFLHRNAINQPEHLEGILQKPFYVPENTPARILLRRFYETRQTFALVVDEYSSISGLITHEDLLEVIVGEITDKRDQVQLYTRAGQNEIIASGKLELSEFNEILNANLVSPAHMTTIGGWLTEHLGEIPKSGSTYELNGFFFQVLAATPSRIRRLYIRKIHLRT
jgi:putative hemolysin